MVIIHCYVSSPEGNYGKIHHAINGKIHYFDWAIFNSYVSNYQRVKWFDVSHIDLQFLICRDFLWSHIYYIYIYLNLIWWIYCIGGYPTKDFYSSSVGNPQPGEGLDWQHIRNEFYGAGALPESFGQVPGSRWSRSPNLQTRCQNEAFGGSVLRFGSIWWEGIILFIILINVYLALNEWTLRKIGWNPLKSDHPIINKLVSPQWSTRALFIQSRIGGTGPKGQTLIQGWHWTGEVTLDDCIDAFRASRRGNANQNVWTFWGAELGMVHDMSVKPLTNWGKIIQTHFSWF